MKNRVYTGVDFESIDDAVRETVKSIFGDECNYGIITHDRNFKDIDDIVGLWDMESSNSESIPVYVDFPETKLHPKDQVRLIRFLADYYKKNPNDFTFFIYTMSNFVLEACEVYFGDTVEFYSISNEGVTKLIGEDNLDSIYKSFADVLQELENDRLINDDKVSYEG